MTVAMAKTTGVVHVFKPGRVVSMCQAIDRTFCHPEVEVDESRGSDLSTCPTCRDRLDS
jgi:hypothetical protein